MTQYVPYKKLSEKEINQVLKNNDWINREDPILDPILFSGGPLYSKLLILAQGAAVLVKRHLAVQSDYSEKLLGLFRISGARYVGRTLLAFAVEIDSVENLTPEKTREVLQVFFERIIISINEQLRP